jgi:hypothetical protein
MLLDRMRTFLVVLRSFLRSRAALELENVALRQQICVLRRSAKKRLKLTATDRLSDGYRLMHMFEDLGLDVESAGNLVESGILEVRHRMRTGRLKVFASLRNYREGLRFYCRDEKGQIVTECDQLQNAARCLVISGISRMQTAPRNEPIEYRCIDLSRHPDSWMA